MSESKQQWASRLGVILAVAGSAVGLGNFLRFPGVAASNGGGAFMIPYFCALLFLGIPIGWVEWTIGRYGGAKGFHSAPAILGAWGKGRPTRYAGVFCVLIPLAVYFYYVIIESWCLSYCWMYLTQAGIGIQANVPVSGQLQTSKDHFAWLSGSAGDGVLFQSGHVSILVFWLITAAFNIYLLYRGISQGIETLCKWAMPAMAVCGLIVLVRVLTLGAPDPAFPEQNVVNGLGFMWNPDFSRLADFETWMAAAGQIFFTLGVGFGIIINYASYTSRKNDIVLSGVTASMTNEFFEVCLGGLITIPAAVVFLGIAEAAKATGSTFSMGFNVLPVVFAHMPVGALFGAIWFFMLFLAAITSSISMIQPALAFFEEALGWTRAQATVLVALICLAGNGFVLWFSRDLAALDTIDFWIGSVAVFLTAGLQVVCFGWFPGIDFGWKEAHEGALMRIPRFYRFVIRYVSPAYLLVVFVGFCYQKAPGYFAQIFGVGGTPANRTVQATWLFLLIVLVPLIGLVALGERRWRREGLDLDGKRD